MIVAITTRGHGDTLVSLSDGSFGFPVPKFVIEPYDKLLCARRVPRATTYLHGFGASPAGSLEVRANYTLVRVSNISMRLEAMQRKMPTFPKKSPLSK